MIKSYEIDKKSENMRIDRWIRNFIGNYPQSLIEKSLRQGQVKINNKKIKSSHKLKLNDVIILKNFNYKQNIKQKKKDFKPSRKVIKANEYNLLENNDNFIIINKESGISVQGGTKSKKNLIDIYNKSKIFENTKPYPVHRLDKDTSGLLIISKNREYAKLFTSLFRLRKIHKTYIAICNGYLIKKSGSLNSNLVRYEGKRKIVEQALSYFKVLKENMNYSMIELKPITGRKHQLRKQLIELGNPIVGESKYLYSEKDNNKNLLLHAYKIKFMLNEKKFNFQADFPKYFQDFINIKKLNI
tara:strand:+ start:427 stop:1326 length:900 start_codon:yes stop_codon:yes gene_type:complete